jgi:hypothetical protein
MIWSTASLVSQGGNPVIRTVRSDVNGVYSAPLLPVGAYSVKVEASGFKTETRTGIALVAFTPGVAIKANPSDEIYIGNSSYSGASATTNITSMSFGEIAAYRAPRRIQLSAKITF